jgi:hypothetical protein
MHCEGLGFRPYALLNGIQFFGFLLYLYLDGLHLTFEGGWHNRHLCGRLFNLPYRFTKAY